MTDPIIQLDPAQFKPHSIHTGERCWAETNCYVDVVIELVHSLGYEPVAALPMTVSIDFELDQWTFFKFAHIDLMKMFGMEIQELNPWRALVGHIEEQVHGGRPVLVEVDSCYLPDTAGTVYHSAHVKSTIAVNEIDIAKKTLGYFHGQGYFELGEKDFTDIFQLDGLAHDRLLPPYIEIVKLHDHARSISTRKLADMSVSALKRQILMLPKDNPFIKFKHKFEDDLGWLLNDSIELFHDYSFATLRQYGACFELAATYTSWLSDNSDHELSKVTANYLTIANVAKTLQFRLARSVARRKALDLAPLDEMAVLWKENADRLANTFC